MAKAKKLPSGNWRCLVYDRSEPVLNPDGTPALDKNGKPKQKRIYESFTADTRKEAEYQAAEFALNKKNQHKPQNYTLREAINNYISDADNVLSPTTIQGYRKISKNSYASIMDIPLKKLNKELLQRCVNEESKRMSKRSKTNPKPVSPKTVRNSYGLITAVINRYHPSLDCSVKLPSPEDKIKELLPPEVVFDVVKGTDIELPVLLAMWLSFSMSEIRGIRKCDIKDGFISINEVMVDVDCKPVVKQSGKTVTRIRKHKIPEYILTLINRQDSSSDMLISQSGHSIYMKWIRLLEKNNLPHMTFHDLRHINASVMALLQIPDKYAMERGGWKTDKVMKRVYTHTFSKERQQVDNIIDNYFTQKLQHEMQHDIKKVP